MAVRFSIVIPTLNEEKFLPHLLESLAAQTIKDFEVIVVDGSSKDKTVSVAQSFAKKLPKLQVIVSPKASLPFQRNLGAKKTTGEWLVFVDADGILLPYFIDRCEAFIRISDPCAFTPWARPDSENPKDAVYTLFYNIYIEATLIFKRPLSPGPLTMVRRDAFDKIDGYDERHEFHEDVDFGLRLYKAGFYIKILRESLFVWSLRRFRNQGILKVMNQYILGFLPILFVNKSFTKMPGYVMGGQLYDKKKKPIAFGKLKQYEKKLKALLKELFE